MLKTILNRIVVLTVLTVGLLSCAKEKAPETITDQFSLGTPEIHSQNSVIYASNKQITGTKFSAEDQIVFPKLKNYDFEAQPVAIATETSCENNDQIFDGTGRFMNTSTIRVKDLLPATALAPDSTLEQLHCKVTMEAMNKFGSRHELTLPLLKIIPSEIVEDLPLQMEDLTIESSKQRAKIFPEQISNLKAIEIHPHDFETKQTLYLVCEHFYSKTSQQVYNAFGISKLISADELAYKGREFRGKASVPKQLCRIVRETKKETRKLEVSPIVEMQFPVPAPQIHTSVFPQKAFGFDRPTVVLSTTVTNPYPFGLYVALKQDPVESLSFRFVSGRAPNPIAAPVQTMTLNWRTTAKPYFSDKKVLKFYISAGESLNLMATADIRTFCGVSHMFIESDTLGVFYDLDSEKLVLHVSNSNRFEKDADISDTFTIPVVTHPILKDRMVPGWTGFKARSGEYTKKPRSVDLHENVQPERLKEIGYNCTTINW